MVVEYRSLGRTDLRVSVAGLGAGGPSRAGQRSGSSEADSVALVRAALDQGVNLLDSAEGYGTERILGLALRDRPRDEVLVSTKVSVRTGSGREGGVRRTGGELAAALEAGLARLDTDYVDIYHLHGVSADDYGYARDVLLPVLVRHRDRGAIRAIGITEAFVADTEHRMLRQAVADACWDVVMVGFNILNQSARELVLAPAQQSGIGVLGMFAVRRALSDPARLAETLGALAADGYLDGHAPGDDPVSWLLAGSDARTLTELAYRFCVHEPGMGSVLFGTGNRDHLDANISALLGPPLPEQTAARLRGLFGQLTHVSAN